ncbi:hypothetical protein F5Y14DRAFT_144488 [Nemania sp. NC0429]|nr:hypothetical protein F5Y14DRAFT_144488 [Nemania sp. NC0429]
MSAITENDAVSPVGNRETFTTNHELIDEEDIDEDLKEACEILLSNAPPVEKENDFTVEGNLQRFVEEWREDFGKTVGNDGNILHRLILKGEEGDIDRLDHLKEAITLIVSDHPHLLWQDQTKNEKQTPLWLAIKKKEASMVMAFMDGLKRSGKASLRGIHDALRQPVDPQRRCMLHWAIDENLSNEAIEALLVYVTDDILLTRDINGHTPLHSAVTYGDCTADRVGVIRHMLRHANHALSVVDKSEHSIYAHHLRTRKLWLDKAAKDAVIRKAQRDKEAKDAVEEFKKAQQSKEQSKDQTAPDPKSEMKTVATRTPLASDVDPKRADKSQQSAPFKQLDPKSESSKRGYDSQKEGHYGGSKRGQDARDLDRNQMTYRGPRNSNQQEGSVDGDPSGLGPGRDPRMNQGSRREPPSDPTPGINRTLSAKGEGQIDHWVRRQDEEIEEGQRGTEQKPPAGSARRRRQRDETTARAAQEKRKRRDAMEKTNAREQAKRRPEILKQNSETVMLEIKLRCMRTLSPRETAKILYGNNPEDRQICFDFPGRPSVRLETFKMSFKNVQFDEVLQYVAFPTVRFEGKNSDEVASARDGLGRKEMVKIFDWLRKTKGVKRIIKIIVNDFDKPAHSDRAILDSLRGFQVEELQWLKTDLDPVTILKVSDDIRKLRLRWSGNNTALRAWSDPYGLRKLPHLDTIQLELVSTEVLESYEDMQVNIKNFEERLNIPHSTETDENKLSAGDGIQPRRVVVKGPAMSSFARSTTSHVASDTDMKHTHIENHKWVETMDNFREEMGPVWKEAEKQARNSNKKDLAEPIVVALIDDGVDVLEPSLQGKLFEGKTLSYDLLDGNEPTDQREHAFWESSGGHGTVMASMIFRICPMAKLYVIRMETHFDSEKRGRIVARSAAEAVNAAVDKGVNIISMSWTIAQNEQSEASGLRNAIERAHNKNILMFASSSDRGYYSDNSWPVAIRSDAFFHIGAAKADGKPFNWAGPVERLNYTFPGVDVIKAQNKSLPPSDSRYQQQLDRMETETGSSVATALAAGTAAMLLTCARIAAIESSDSSRGVTRNVLREMQKRDNMATALDRLGISLGENKFIEVWRTLNTQEWPGFSEQRPEGKMKMVADKITSFLPTPLIGK